MTDMSGVPRTPSRRLGLREGVTIGLGSMIGAGLFAAFAPAAARAGDLLLLAVVVAALLCAAGAHSMVRLAGRHHGQAGVYIYGRERLGLPFGYLAGWAFIVGKTASCAAMAMTVGLHLWPDYSKLVASLAVLAVLALDLQGARSSERLRTVLVLLVIALTVTFAVVMLVSPPVTADEPPPPLPGSGGVRGVLEATGFLFFAFMGFARLAPFGDLVEDAPRTIPRALTISLVLVTGLYLLVALALPRSLGPGWVAARQSPLAEAAEISGWPWLGPALRIGAVLVVGGALLSLMSGVARIVLAMARDHHLPAALGTVEGRHRVPRRAVGVVAVGVVVLIMLVDVRGAMGYSAFLGLSYYGITHASAWTLDRSVLSRLVPTLGLLACTVVALLLPWQSVAAGIVTLALGAFTGWVRWTTREDRPT